MEKVITYWNTKSENKKYFISFFIFSILVLIIFKQYPRYDYIDYGVYEKYAVSIVEDGNLNISDELYNLKKARGLPVIQTKTNYDPDFHSHGSSFLFAPFLLFKNILNLNIDEGKIQDVLSSPWLITKDDLIRQNIFAILINLSIIIGVYLVLNIYSNSLQQIVAGVLLFLGTPLYMYSVYIPGNMNVVCFLLFSILFKYLYEKKFKCSLKEIIAINAYISILFVIKADAFFLAFLIPFIYFENKIKPRHIILSLIPVLLVFVLYLINRYIQYGSLHIGYGGITTSFIPLNIFFDPFSGFFYTSPLFLVLALIYFVKFRSDRYLNYLLLIIFLRYIAVCFTFDSGIDFGDRSSLNEIYIWALVLLKIFRDKCFYKYLPVLLICTIWTIVLSVLYLQVPFFESYSFYFNSIYLNFMNIFEYFLFYFNANYFIELKIRTVLISSIIALLLFKLKLKFERLPYIFICGYLFVTFLNFINRSNVTTFEDAVVTDDVKVWYSLENISNR